MNLVRLYNALHDITACIGDGTGAPGGKRFWSEVKARLADYAKHTAAGTQWRASDHQPFARPTLEPRTFSGLRRGYAASSAGAIANMGAWSETGEGPAFWGAINRYFNNLAHESTDDVPRIPGLDRIGTYLSAYSEYNACREAKWERPAFTLTPWYRPGTFVHHDPEDRTLVRYCPSNRSPMPRNFVTAKPGKFLTAYFSDLLSAPEIADYAAKHRADGEPPTLLIARTAEEISMVYRLGPDSCMSHGKTVHGHEPIRAYASPDLAVAYLMRNNKPTARCVVRPEKNVYSRIYGDSSSLTAALRANGFVHAAYSHGMDDPTSKARLFDNARVAVIRADGQIPAHLHYEQRGEPVAITPYWDLRHAARFDPDDGYLHLLPDTAANFPEGPGQHAKHHLHGGFSIPAIPATGPELHSNEPCRYLFATVGSYGQNTRAAVSWRESGRTRTSTTTAV